MHFFKSLRARLTTTPDYRGISLPNRFKKIEYLQLIIENMTQSMLIIDKKGFIQFVNNAFCKTWDYNSSEVVGQHFSLLLSPANQQRELALFERLIDGTSVKSHQTLIRKKDGSYKHALVSASYEAIGGSKHFISLISDIDEFIKTKDQLTKSEKELSEIYSTSNAVQWEASTITCTFRRMSQRITELTGYSVNQWISPGFVESVLLSVNGSKGQNFFDVLKSTAMPATIELQIKAERGVKWLRIEANENPSDHAYIFSGFIFDITREKNAELENQHLIAKLRQENALKDDFLAHVSHELRTPVSIILGWVELLIRNKVEPEKVLDAYRYMEKNAKLQIKLIDDLLDLARIEQGTLHSRIEFVNITECFKNALDSFQAAIHAKKIKVSARIPNRSIEVIGDQDRLTQIFWNILSNAVKFTPEEGAILIDIEIFQDKVEIRVEDTGTGIEREFLPHIFEKFTRESDLIRRQTGGLGLGLSIVKTLTETHGGSIAIDSDGIGKGTCVTLRFPYISHSDSEITRIPVYGGDDLAMSLEFLKDLKILLVDDVADVTEILQTMLARKGANIVACSNVNDAYQSVLSFNPDVLISDVAMPGHSGVDLIQKIRTLKSEEGGAIPAIALTAFLRSTSEKQLLDAGFDKVLSKPVKSAELFASIREVLTRPVRPVLK